MGLGFSYLGQETSWVLWKMLSSKRRMGNIFQKLYLINKGVEMKHTKKDFEEAAARVRCLNERDRKSHAISLIEKFKGTNPKFDPD